MIKSIKRIVMLSLELSKDILIEHII